MIEIARWLGRGLWEGLEYLTLFLFGAVKFLLSTAWFPAVVMGIVWFGYSQVPENPGELVVIAFVILAMAVIIVGAVVNIYFQGKVDPFLWSGKVADREHILINYLMWIMVMFFFAAFSG